MCPCHPGKPFGVFADGRVAEVKSLAGSGMVIKARLGSQNGDEIEFPFHADQTTAMVYYENGGQWNSFYLSDGFLTGIFDIGSGIGVLGGVDPDDAGAQISAGLSDVPVDYVDICGKSARLIAKNVLPRAWGDTRLYTYDGVELYGSRLANTQEGKKSFELLMHTQPRRYVDKPMEYRALWPGPSEGFAFSNTADYETGFTAIAERTDSWAYNQGFTVWPTGNVSYSWLFTPSQNWVALP